MISDTEPFAKVEEGAEPYPNATTNACKLCTPLGACLAFKGIEGAVPFLHGSQGCATYIRRYLISHFREPMDIAASNFSEQSAVFGGAANLMTGLDNVIRQYQPSLIGLATTCLSETIGEDMPGHLRAFRDKHPDASAATPIVSVSTASYRGTHADGFHDALTAVVATFVNPGSGLPPTERSGPVLWMPGMVSAADLRECKRLAAAFELPITLLPDYSDTLDGVSWSDYEKLPPGGTPLASLQALAQTRAVIESGRILSAAKQSAGRLLQERTGSPLFSLGLPIGLRETEALLETLSELSGRPIPASLAAEKGRLVDSWVDGHKYVFEKRAIVYGEEDLVIGLASFLKEIGIIPVVCASGGRSGRFKTTLQTVLPDLDERTHILEGADFSTIAEVAASTKPDLIIGSSKGYGLARKLNIPLIRRGFPIHDRLGGQRLLHIGYAGAQALYDDVVNALLERKQSESSIGYSYL